MNVRARMAALAIGCLIVLPIAAQDKAGKRDDLDVTMQIIVDPNAKLPDDVVRHIPLPTSRATPARDPAAKSPPKPDAATKEKAAAPAKDIERPQATRELGREAAESGKERAREAREQRDEARDANAKERDKDKDRGRPDRPNPPRPRD
jgi:hypothetical protein